MATEELQEAPAVVPGCPETAVSSPRRVWNQRKPTGELVRQIEPGRYRRILDLLAEPRELMPYNEIQRLCKVGEATLKAIQTREQESIAERKQKLLSMAQRCSERAWGIVEDKLTDDIKLGQAVMVAGIATDKVIALTAEQIQPTAQLNVNLNITDAYSEFMKVSQAIKQAVARDVSDDKPTLQLPDETTKE